MSTIVAPAHVRPGRAIVLAGVDGRVIAPGSGDAGWGLDDELATGCWSSVTDDIVAELEKAGLRGRGGAAFPAHLKWQAVRDGEGPRTVVANGEEGEPASAKDQWLLLHRPHLVLHGLHLAAVAVGARRAVVYLSHRDTVAPVERAIGEARVRGLWPESVELTVHVVEPTYVAGEETSVVRSINGGPALPLAKPPRPFEEGVDGGPTLVTNVETLAHASWIAAHGADAFASVGTSTARGTALFTIGASGHDALVVEAPLGVRLAELAALIDLSSTDVTGALVGGWFGGLASVQDLDIACCPEDMTSRGFALGCGAVTFLVGEDPIEVAAAVAAWYEAESARQCGVCIKGTESIAAALKRLRAGGEQDGILADLTRWGTALRRRGACGLLDGAANLARTTADVVRANGPRTGTTTTPREGTTP